MLKEKIHKTFCLLLLSAGVLFASPACSQNIEVSAHLDTSVIRLGEQARITLRVNLPYGSKQTVHWPSLSDTLVKGVNVLDRSGTDTLRRDSAGKDKVQRFSQTLLITSFDSGYYAIPPFSFYLNKDSLKPLLTDALLLQVKGMRVDTTLSIKDIKKPVSAPFDWHELIPLFKWIALILAVLILIVFVVIRFYKKRPAAAPVAKKIIPSHVIAMQALIKLREEMLWQNGKTKEYHSRLTDILRLYIEQRFAINALEQTTLEIIRSFRSVPIKPENKNRLRQIFELADLVKFAKQQALPNENEMSMDNAILFVQETRELEHTHQETMEGN